MNIALPVTTDTGEPVAPSHFCEEVSARPEAPDALVALHYFQRWLMALRSRNLVVPNADTSVVRIHPDVTARFGLGKADKRIFLAVPFEEMCWFGSLPWLHVAVRPGATTINLVCDEMTMDGYYIPAFAITLHNGSAKKVSELSRFKYMDVRSISAYTHQVAAEISRTIDVVLVEDDRDLPSLVAGRLGRTVYHRSQSKKVGP